MELTHFSKYCSTQYTGTITEMQLFFLILFLNPFYSAAGPFFSRNSFAYILRLHLSS